MKLRWIIMRASCWTGVWVIERTHLWVYVRAYAVKSAEHADHQWETSTLVTTRGVRRWRRRRKETESGLLTPSGRLTDIRTDKARFAHTVLSRWISWLSVFLSVRLSACLSVVLTSLFLFNVFLVLEGEAIFKMVFCLILASTFYVSNKVKQDCGCWLCRRCDGRKKEAGNWRTVSNLKIRILYKFDMYIYQYTLV